MTGALVEFIFNIEPPTEDEVEQSAVSTGKKKRVDVGSQVRPRPVRERIGSQSLFMTWAATGVILSIVIWCFFFYAPLTYGQPGLEVDQVLARKWLNYDFHFAK